MSLNFSKVEILVLRLMRGRCWCKDRGKGSVLDTHCVLRPQTKHLIDVKQSKEGPQQTPREHVAPANTT